MALLLDANLWIDFSRKGSPAYLKAFVESYVNDPQACTAEPVVFEVLRSASSAEARQLTACFETIPMLQTPIDLWSRAARLGRECKSAGLNMSSLDLVIAAIAIYHAAELVTFDSLFEKLAGHSELKVRHLRRPTA